MNRQAIAREVTKEYETMQRENKMRLNQRKNLIYAEIPEILSIDEELADTGIGILKSLMEEKKDPRQLIENLEKKTLDLMQKRAELLVLHAYPPTFLDLKYNCMKCLDTGLDQMTKEKCSCYQQKFVRYAYHKSKLEEVLRRENFNTFNLEYYSNETNSKENISPRGHMSLVKSWCVDFIENFEHTPANFLFTGKTGLGKTFLCHAIAKELLDQSQIVIYLSSFELMKWIEKIQFNQYEEGETNPIKDFVLADLLILDDLGTEFVTSLTNSYLFNILNTRLLNEKSTIISTNLSVKDLLDIYSDRIVSRIQGNYRIIKFFGDDIRILKKYKELA